MVVVVGNHHALVGGQRRLDRGDKGLELALMEGDGIAGLGFSGGVLS